MNRLQNQSDKGNIFSYIKKK